MKLLQCECDTRSEASWNERCVSEGTTEQRAVHSIGWNEGNVLRTKRQWYDSEQATFSQYYGGGFQLLLHSSYIINTSLQYPPCRHSRLLFTYPIPPHSLTHMLRNTRQTHSTILFAISFKQYSSTKSQERRRSRSRTKKAPNRFYQLFYLFIYLTTLPSYTI